MDVSASQEKNTRSNDFCYRDGRLYFTRQVERRLFFGGTVIMLLYGLLVKIGIL